MGPKNELSVYVVEDDAALRKSLCWLVESVGLRVKPFASAQQFLEFYRPGLSGCLILDVRMPGMSGLELQQRLKEQKCHLPIIIITGYADVPMAVRAMKAGAIDFIEKPVSDQTLLDRVQQAIAEEAETSVSRADQIQFNSRLELLTGREKEVMHKVIAGMSSREIGLELGVSFKTVEAHRAKIMKKMQASSVPQLVRMYLSSKA